MTSALFNSKTICPIVANRVSAFAPSHSEEEGRQEALVAATCAVIYAHHTGMDVAELFAAATKFADITLDAMERAALRREGGAE